MGWQFGKVAMVVRWQFGKARSVVRWQGRKVGRVVRWQGGRSLVLFNGGGRRVTPIFHLFVSHANQRDEELGFVQDSSP